MLNTHFSPWPSFTEEEAEAVKQVILSNRVNYWTGRECRAFEKEFASLCDCEYAVAVANGTLALDACWAALDIGPGDEVIVTSRTFLASASSIANSGARPVFADVDRDSQNITVGTIEPLLTSKTKAILCVHLGGWPCDMDSINTLAKEHSLFVVEDCAQAHGAKINGKSVGSFGDLAAWSFCQDKIMTTGGEGGMVTTNNQELWSKVWSLKDHGKDYDTVYHKQHPPGFRWLHNSLGHNWRMMEVQAAIGRIQLKRMPDWKETRTKNAMQIAETCKGMPCLRTPLPSIGREHAWYKFYTFVRPESLKSNWTRDRIMNTITEQGAPCFSGSCSEVYLEGAFQRMGLAPSESLPIAKELGETALMFLVHPTLTSEEIEKTCNVIKSVCEQAKR
ncbi:DegT/DnrJ/EryC1/StrS aminotransferase family protein [Pelagicoccus sp. SDUM812005]|uniref:DegT/DnrJ/EryC1/StrS family aminotransferase n=1 Tax=Pelagicoccus sp. SDUM812005 TaxID=3041257 RepID=UPI00280F251A|nr:DegT/DnrJ/EryC1/StrS aminotransferase family protein [Pelagicoccus sp. SDUM812005]MDQ8180801.1 DegT/DnrJ/EryC1/StrS aminotransferase family protein [Pelagicoccus sp. SDUM812005]